jgi:hypothetical protein
LLLLLVLLLLPAVALHALLLCVSSICLHLLSALWEASKLADRGRAAGIAGASSATTNLQMQQQKINSAA